MGNLGGIMLAAVLAASCIPHANRPPKTTVGAAAAGNGSTPRRGPAPEPPEAPLNPGLVPPGIRVGTVRAIGTGRSFVLLETANPGGAAGILDGQQLRCVHTAAAAADAVEPFAVVRVSRERRPPFIVADVLSGQPQAGDDVYAVKAGSAAPFPSTTPSATSFLLPPAARPTAPPAASPAPHPSE